MREPRPMERTDAPNGSAPSSGQTVLLVRHAAPSATWHPIQGRTSAPPLPTLADCWRLPTPLLPCPSERSLDHPSRRGGHPGQHCPGRRGRMIPERSVRLDLVGNRQSGPIGTSHPTQRGHDRLQLVPTGPVTPRRSSRRRSPSTPDRPPRFAREPGWIARLACP